ncbi:hypothetical protein [Flavobacterium sp. 5]|uniref:hypothetical protein n=1 Tax=Flavobacterium sp. 5 TaxID=2035199 RepID=UPI000C2BFD45|nr:hypothetical protein [Flavobacterium sp. 5]PKB15667.1 hypothetical protein CLU82_0753 [Flavobacterium sp. 5]
MKNFTSKLLLGFILFTTTITNAHNTYLQVKGSGKINDKVEIQIFKAEYGKEAPEKGTKIDNLKAIKIYLIDASGSKTEITMTQTETHWQGFFVPKTTGNYQIIGINDQNEVKDMSKKHLGLVRSILYLKTNYTVKTSKAIENTIFPLDITAQKQNTNYLLTAFKDKKQQANLAITVINPDGWVQTLESNEIGQANFTPNKKGLYLVNLEWIDNTKGNFKDKAFDNTINKTVLSLIIE